MGKYAVPENIRKKKPRGTMVKRLHGKYYVYQYAWKKNEDGKWKTKMGKLIGTITEENGFIPNNNFAINEDITTLEYGQYAIVYESSKNVLELLKQFFNPIDACQIYFMAVIHYLNKFSYLKYMNDYFEQCYLSIEYPNIKMGYTALSSLLDSLGRRQASAEEFQQYLIEHSSGEIAIDGHVISCSSHSNDLAEYGNKFSSLREMQINVLMAYDINNLKPVFSKVYEGGLLDKTSVQDVLKVNEFKNMLFIIDKGFYSKENIELFSQDSNQYIVPLPQNLKDYKEVTNDMNLSDIFVYERNRKVSSIEYKEVSIDKKRIIVYRDLSQNAIDKANYLKNMECDPEKYSKERFNQVKDFFGVIVLQTNCENKTPQEIFELYKKRWRIETYYDYFKNNLNCNALNLSNYYMTQGLSFVMLIVGLIHKEIKDKIKEANIKTSIDDCLLKARFIKLTKTRSGWTVSNAKKDIQSLFSAFGIDLTDVSR